jgi:molybdenum cofactor cytidylyltransferase
LIGGIVLAAGEGRRFGGPKQVARLHGRPLLEYAIEAQSRVPAIERIVVVLGAHAEQVRAEVDFLDAEPIVCEHWSEGRSASLRAGIEELEDPDGVIVTLGDQPGITPQVVAMILDQFDSQPRAARAVYDGRPGHPVLIKRSLFPQLRAVRGEDGARGVLERTRAARIEVGHLCDPQDVDTPEDLVALTKRTAPGS